MRKFSDRFGIGFGRGFGSRAGSGSGSAFSGQSGASIVIALILIAAITFFTIGISSTAMTALKTTSYSKKALQAEYMAHGAFEVVKMELKDIELGEYGYVSGEVVVEKVCDDGVPCYGFNVYNDQSTYATYNIATIDNGSDTVYLNSSYGTRSAPVLGTGNVGEDCDLYSDSELQGDYNHPCNWNKLYYGESVTIPLFVRLGNVYVGLGVWSSFSKLTIRVRTPCVPGGSGSNCERYALVPDSGPGIPVGGSVLVSWQVIGECGGEVCGVAQSYGDVGGSAFYPNKFDDEGYAKVIEGDTVLDSYKTVGGEAVSGTLAQFLRSQGSWAGNVLKKEYLKLSYVKEAVSNSVLGSGNVPYLEYQIMYGGGNVVLTTSPLFNVTAYAQGFKYTLEGVQDLGSNLFDFAVQN